MTQQPDSQPRLEVIYVLGNSFSGSTLLGFLLAGSPDVLGLGELKMHNRIDWRVCSCGAKGTECPFWSYWDAKGYQLYSSSRGHELSLVARTLLGISGRDGSADRGENDDLRFLRSIWAESGKPRYLVDISKSLWRLDHLRRTPGINVHVIRIKRRTHGTISSFVKRSGRFWRPLFRCLVNDHLCDRFLAQNPDLPQLEVRHEELCDDPDGVMDRIGQFLGIDYTDYARYLDSLDYHVRGGNQMTIKGKRQGIVVTSSEEEEKKWRSVLGEKRIRLLDRLPGVVNGFSAWVPSAIVTLGCV